MIEEPFNERDKRQLDLQLDRELRDTFPASDPLTITRFPLNGTARMSRKSAAMLMARHPTILAGCDIKTHHQGSA